MESASENSPERKMKGGQSRHLIGRVAMRKQRGKVRRRKRRMLLRELIEKMEKLLREQEEQRKKKQGKEQLGRCKMLKRKWRMCELRVLHALLQLGLNHHTKK
ncbi:hypothetical protein ANCCAN_28334 [Ancylostoma caninum]|uniref:Uncharacterized protein n=1 Tax=Ancylostoma caninum TaxID=29170 RepID=A0A368F4N2_ANCCA|nr:hypothetical protein ANCCAN_28334 [Ancylostoma caninum]